MLERLSQPDPTDEDEATPRPRTGLGGGLSPWQRFKRSFGLLGFSSLTRRILFLNLAGLVVLVVGILWLSQFRAGLIDARVQSLLVQGEIIAGAIAASATVDNDGVFADPERLLEPQTDGTWSFGEEGFGQLHFPINPERVAPVLRRLVSPTNTRARIYDRDGSLVLDSRALYRAGEILRFELPPPNAREPAWYERWLAAMQRWWGRGDLPEYVELGPENGRGYSEVVQALGGQKASVVRVDDRGRIVVSVAVPVQRFRAVQGVLLLSTRGGDIDAMVEAERFAVLKVFLVAAGVMAVLSLLLASTIAGPMHRLSEAADRVRRRIRTRVEIPEFPNRRDEIGHLSRSLRDMTNALYTRIEAIERFAADVAHELKNPLTSLRSAVETLPLARNENSRARLLEVIQHDVKRLDRLISDISDASRLDAELQRQDAEPVDLEKLLSTVVDVANGVRRGDGVNVTLEFEGGEAGEFMVAGNDSRLGQVVNNLIDNARSFSPRGRTVRVICRRLDDEDDIEIVVEDEGPGIRADALDKIFLRFYTDRPVESYGNNSGLGLSISKQIVEAHGGRIWAENRPADPAALAPAAPVRQIGEVVTDDDDDEDEELEARRIPGVAGARFTVRLPAL